MGFLHLVSKGMETKYLKVTLLNGSRARIESVHRVSILSHCTMSSRGKDGGETLDSPKPRAELDDRGSECCVAEKGGGGQRY